MMKIDFSAAISAPRATGIFLLFIVLFLLGFQLSAHAKELDEISASYHRADTIDERLEIVAEAVNQNVIRKGMPVSDLDKIFDSHLRSEKRPAEGGVASIPIVVSNKQSPWYCTFQLDHTGALVRFTLSNCDSTAVGTPPVVSTWEARSQLQDRYKQASDGRERLRICIILMTQNIIQHRKPVSNISEIMGAVWKQERSEVDGQWYSIALNDSCDGWRLCFSVKDGLIDRYYLTSM